MTHRQLLGIVLTGVFGAWNGPPAAAAQTAVPLESVSNAVPVGEQVTIAQAGSQTKGVVTAIDAAILRLTDDAGRDRGFALAGVDRIQVHDSVANGALIGGLAGAAPGAYVGLLLYAPCMGDYASVAKCLPGLAVPIIAGAAVGSLAGMVFDDMYQRTIVVRPARPVVMAAPWFDGHGGGVVMRLVY